jgi:ERCC4-type nuclease
LAKKPQVTIQESLENAFVEPTADDTTVQTPESYATFVKKVKKENITPENMGEILLCQIPGISAIYAQAIIKHFGGFSKMMAKIQEPETLKEFENIQYEVKGKMRRIPKTCGTEIARLL